MENYKLRNYYTSGPKKGNVKNEELFDTKEQLDARYQELSRGASYNMRPTAWKKNGTEWTRMAGY